MSLPLLVALLLFAATCVALALLRLWRRPLPLQRVLQAARAHSSAVSAAQIGKETRLPLGAVRRALEELTYAGACQRQLNDAGDEVYAFDEQRP